MADFHYLKDGCLFEKTIAEVVVGSWWKRLGLQVLKTILDVKIEPVIITCRLEERRFSGLVEQETRR